MTLLATVLLCNCSNTDSNDPEPLPKTVATYNITFTNTWNELDHGPLPNNPHWSKLVGATHNSSKTFLEVGGVANQGIEDIAERGVNDVFKDDVLSAITNGQAEQYIDGNGLNLANGSTIEILNLEVNQDFPLLTLVSMIAPSPDWMVFVNGINLRNAADSEWLSSLSIDLYVHDSGTDSGTSYSASDADITPHIPITSLKNIMPFNNEKVGVLEISLQKVTSLSN